ncbi:MAG: hypothetical protein LBG17_04205, partial [Bacteroidales bacterium]|nr:hypothetical protein [Bacteroidales bacterium]
SLREYCLYIQYSSSQSYRQRKFVNLTIFLYLFYTGNFSLSCTYYNSVFPVYQLNDDIPLLLGLTINQ